MKEYTDSTIPNEKKELLWQYAGLIHDYNQTINITGLKDRKSIYHQLVIGSIEPLQRIDVPRGTSFVDIGTGAGIPGIPLLLYFNSLINGVMIDSNNKKIRFVQHAVQALNLSDCAMIVHGRIEELAHSHIYRETFDFAVSRAFAHPLMALEYAFPFVKKGGWLYIYADIMIGKSHNVDTIETAHKRADTTEAHNTNAMHEMYKGCFYAEIIKVMHARVHELGGHMASVEESETLGIHEGLLFIKDNATPQKYPRKNAVVKREIEQYRTKQ